MVSKLPETPSAGDPSWLAEVIYRFSFAAAHRPLPSDANAARLRLEGGNRASLNSLIGRPTPNRQN